MEGYASTLRSLGEIEKLEIPFFQRPYVWGEPQFDALVNSFVETEGSKMPFFGSIIFCRADRAATVDGRLDSRWGQAAKAVLSLLIVYHADLKMSTAKNEYWQNVRWNMREE
jgi:hypothetical protein